MSESFSESYKLADSIPSASELKKIMRSLANELFIQWKSEISDRLYHLELEGFITKDNVQVSSSVWRLPNTEVRYALCRLQQDMESLGYDYDFKFDNVSDSNWTLYYKIAVPDTCEDECYEDMKELLSNENSDR